MVIDDHINLMGATADRVNDRRLGPRFPRYVPAVRSALIERALEIARRENFAAHRGVYVAVTGPISGNSGPNPLLRLIGADVVGLSTIFRRRWWPFTAACACLGLSSSPTCAARCAQGRPHREILAGRRPPSPSWRKIGWAVLDQEARAA